MGKSMTNDEEFLARVENEAPELLNAEIDGELFDALTKELIDEMPAPKKKRLRLKKNSSKR
jgi:hypothetical protein